MKLCLATSVAALALIAGCGNAIEHSGPSFGVSTTTGGSSPGGFAGNAGGPSGGAVGLYDYPVVISKTPPPPVSGGTLIVITGGRFAAMADPDRDRVVIVDLTKLVLSQKIALRKGDEPGRLVENAAGLLHVVLRGSGSVATIDPLNGTELRRDFVCANPRGIAYDRPADLLHVACTGGELVSLKPGGGAPVRQLKLDDDLRDIVVDNGRLMVSRFRAAEVLVVEADGRVSSKIKPPGIEIDPNVPKDSTPLGFPGRESFAPAVAWRMVPAPGGGALMTYQLEQTSEVATHEGGYGGFCGGIVRGAVSLIRTDGIAWNAQNTGVVLPVDVAARSDLSQITVAAAGAIPASPFIAIAPVVNVTPPIPGNDFDKCAPGTDAAGPAPQTGGQAVAVAFDASNRLLVQTRDPMLLVGNRGISLEGELMVDTGHNIFHMGTRGGGIACASCHPEGREDGHTWTFESLGARRTQTLGGGTLGAGPYHWNGDMRDFRQLSQEIFNQRMSGPGLIGAQVEALFGWIDQIPAWKPETNVDPIATDRGRAIFNDASVGCATCHTGPSMTNHAKVDVGTGAPFRVPSLLGVGFRAPFMHNGCAPTLADRFGACGGDADKHGNITRLSDAQRADLLTYLGTL